MHCSAVLTHAYKHSRKHYRGSVKNTCKMLMALGIGSRDVYEEDFERPLLEESREFYRVSVE